MRSSVLTANKWGFSVKDDNPFAIFRSLQKMAAEAVGENNVIDLSRGDPGYGFTPSVRGRRFYSYLLVLDTAVNNGEKRASDIEDFDKVFREVTFQTYEKMIAEDLLKDLRTFIDGIKKSAEECGLKWSNKDVYKKIFRFSAVSGGCYLEPKGEIITRVVLASWYKKFIKTEIDHEDIVLFNGASHAIGTFFKVLGKEGLDFLNEKSTVMMCSPSYSPYLVSMKNRGINVASVEIDPVDGSIKPAELDELNGVKALILIDPNNPTGFSIEPIYLEKIAAAAERNNSIILTDEVYCSFFPKKKTILDYCPERTIRIDARSKTERSTGLRFGDVLISKKANDFISNNILKDSLGGGDFRSYVVQSKGPGGCHGEFQHTTFVPGPSQFLGISHMLLGGDERKQYVDSVKNNGEIFSKILGIKSKGNLYYTIFDMNEIPGCRKNDVPIEQKLIELAKRGVVYLPVNLFFSEKKRIGNAVLNMVRVSVVNTSYEKVKKAAEITKNYFCS